MTPPGSTTTALAAHKARFEPGTAVGLVSDLRDARFRFHDLVDAAGKIRNIYHYVLNSEYPYSVGCFGGAIDPASVAATPLPLLGQMPMPGMSMPGMGH